MSVLVNGMELPKNCAECKFSDVFAYPPDYDDEWICELNYLSMTWEDAQMRHSNCPLVEIATPHGRLIDAGALLESIKEARKKDPEIEDVYTEDYFTVAEWVVSSPTIIGAEGIEDG